MGPGRVKGHRPAGGRAAGLLTRTAPAKGGRQALERLYRAPIEILSDSDGVEPRVQLVGRDVEAIAQVLPGDRCPLGRLETLKDDRWPQRLCERAGKPGVAL